MGIPRFFYYCFKNFDSTVEYIYDSINNTSVDFIHFDLNAIIHPVCQEVFKYGNHAPEQSSLIKHPKHVSVTSARITEVYDKVCSVIEKYVNIVKPSSGIYIAIDGVAGMSKCTQQRQRRFRNTSSDDKKFDPNCISTGTVFMDRLCKHIDTFLRQMVSTKWNNLELIFSNDKVSGEGEHKILKHLQLNPEISSVVISPDADLFMLLLGCVKFDDRKLYIFRENIYNNIDCKYFLVDICKLANEICKQVDENKKFDKSSVIRDFIFYCFMLGNDFLPHLPCVDLSHRGLELLFDIYSQTIDMYGLLIKNDNVNIKSFIYFLEQIANNEKKILLEQYKNNKVYNDPYLIKCLRDQEGKDMDMEKYRNLYYSNKLDITEDKEVLNICKDYIEGMMFVFRYYTKGIPSWKWFYNHHYAPFAYDIARCIKSNDKVLDCHFNKGEKMSPIQQLMCILPPSSKKLLPECLQPYYEPQNRLLGRWMTKDVKIDYEFKQNEWEGLVLLPFIETKDFEEVYKLEYGKFSMMDKNRDCEGKIFVYYQEFNPNTNTMENVMEMVKPTEIIDADNMTQKSDEIKSVEKPDKVETEKLGKVFEMAICLAIDTKYDGKFKYDISEARHMVERYNLKKIKNNFNGYKHTAIGGARYDFSNGSGKYLSAKTSKIKDAKIGVQCLGQVQPKKFCDYFNIEFTDILTLKKFIQNNTITILKKFEEYTFDCPIIYFNQALNTMKIITQKSKINWESFEYEWTLSPENWNGSSTLKIKNKNTKSCSLVEFQFHSSSRNNIAARWFLEKLLSVCKDYFTIETL